jgi:hypothetical protein
MKTVQNHTGGREPDGISADGGVKKQLSKKLPQTPDALESSLGDLSQFEIPSAQFSRSPSVPAFVLSIPDLAVSERATFFTPRACPPAIIRHSTHIAVRPIRETVAPRSNHFRQAIARDTTREIPSDLRPSQWNFVWSSGWTTTSPRCDTLSFGLLGGEIIGRR